MSSSLSPAQKPALHSAHYRNLPYTLLITETCPTLCSLQKPALPALSPAQKHALHSAHYRNLPSLQSAHYRNLPSLQNLPYTLLITETCPTLFSIQKPALHSADWATQCCRGSRFSVNLRMPPTDQRIKAKEKLPKKMIKCSSNTAQKKTTSHLCFVDLCEGSFSSARCANSQDVALCKDHGCPHPHPLSEHPETQPVPHVACMPERVLLPSNISV
ncbi:hypothetical protein JZ751_025487 [Albula glossodonta]|uniref:Uncharacterized protein n=1 Tax=Albula glossodonta TaxID=121402 RepID=A0A8T2NEF1_9TELE|nr:hypothetical protein JZ751_025487 [Albula glossodonta]